MWPRTLELITPWQFCTSLASGLSTTVKDKVMLPQKNSYTKRTKTFSKVELENRVVHSALFEKYCDTDTSVLL